MAKFIIWNNLALIPLLNTNGRFAIIDKDSIVKVLEISDRWFLNNYGYACFYKCIRRKVKTFFLHSVIMGEGFGIDHINRVKLTNTKNNLRFVTFSQNNQNKDKIKNNSYSSIFKGVTWCDFTKKWRAVIGINHKQVHIGRYNSETNAALAYNEKAKELYGEFAFINKV